MGLPRRTLALACAFMALSAAARSEQSYRGRPLVAVLRELQGQGLDLVYSSLVVVPELVIANEPLASSPRARLDQILIPLGLEARDGPGGSIVILRARATTGSLQGRVISAADQRPVAGATVRVRGAPSATATDRAGRFDLRPLTPGLHDLEVEASAYSSLELTGIRVEAGAPAHLKIVLEPLTRFVSEVVVTPGQRSVVLEDPAARHATARNDMQIAPATGGDLSRTIEMLPGVATPDNSAAFHVRGSVSRDVSLVLDGLELYDPFHLQSFQSPFSVIDGNVADRFEFLGGGFTADRGDRHGAFVDISTLLPGASSQGALELGTLNSRASYASPELASKGSWLVSGRGWYPEALFHSTELGGGENLDPHFLDLYVKATTTLRSRHRLSAHALGVYDRLRYQEAGEELNESVDATTRNAYLWLRASSPWSEELVSDTLVSAGWIDRERRGLSTAGDVTLVNDLRRVDFLALQHASSYQLDERNLLKAGIELRTLESEYRYTSRGPEAPRTTTALDFDGLAVALHGAWRVRPSSKFGAEMGLRWDRQEWTQDEQLSPRLNLLWQPSGRAELRLALGRFAQSQRLHELQVEDGEVRFERAESASSADLSLLYRIGNGLRLRADAYHRRISRVRPRWENLFEPIELFPETASDRVRVAPESARLSGLELLLQGADSRPWVWWLSYALSSAEDRIDDAWVARSWDQRHSGKLLVGYRLDPRWSIAVHGTAHSGWPTTPVSARAIGEPGTTEGYQVVPGRRNSETFAPYLRLDLKASGSIRLPRGRLRLTAEILNLSDRQNQCCVNDFVFTPRPDGGADVEREFGYWRGLTPSFHLRWEF